MCCAADTRSVLLWRIVRIADKSRMWRPHLLLFVFHPTSSTGISNDSQMIFTGKLCRKVAMNRTLAQLGRRGLWSAAVLPPLFRSQRRHTSPITLAVGDTDKLIWWRIDDCYCSASIRRVITRFKSLSERRWVSILLME